MTTSPEPGSKLAEFAAQLSFALDPFQIDAIFEETRRRFVFQGGFAGAMITALTGIEIALWDLKGKALGVPVYELFGGPVRERIPVLLNAIAHIN